MSEKKTTPARKVRASKAEDTGITLDLAAEGRKCDRTARRVLDFVNAGDVPEYLTDAVMSALIGAANLRHGGVLPQPRSDARPPDALWPEERGQAMKERRSRTPTTKREEARLRAVCSPDSDADLDELSNELGAFLSTLIYLGTPASADLAAKVYRLCCAAWQRNRCEVYGEANMTDAREQNTVRAHGDLLDQLARLEGPAELPTSDEWAGFDLVNG